MKLYQITIRPTSNIGTPLKGDTLFGQFCWQVYQDYSIFEGGLERYLESYLDRPFLIFSSAVPRLTKDNTCFAMKRPDVPLSVLFPIQGKDRLSMAKQRMEHKKKKWMLVGQNLDLSESAVTFVDDEQLAELFLETLPTIERRRIVRVGFCGKRPHEKLRVMCGQLQPHNTINRETWTTGEGEFAPYNITTTFYIPGVRLALFALLDEALVSINAVVEALRRIGQTGFGKDASIGKGRFNVEEWTELKLPKVDGANACYCLSPCVPKKDSFSRAFFVPFVRFGKHGAELAQSRNPFKNPVIMADEGAVFFPKDSSVFDCGYFGQGVTGISKIQPKAVMQGHTICLPMKLEIHDD